MFDKLKGIEKEREEKERENNIAYLIGFGESIIEHQYLTLKEREPPALMFNEIPKEIYNTIYRTAKAELPDFTGKDIEQFIRKADTKQDKARSKLLGMYSGCLLQILTERNREKKERTRLYFNGQGKHFSYLFSFTDKFDELIVDGFKGENICSNMRCGNKKGILVGLNLEGDRLMHHNGEEDCISMIIAKNIKGKDYSVGANGREGEIGLILAQNISGKGPFIYTAVTGGKAGFVFAENITGNGFMQFSGVDEGKIDLIYARNISGKRPLYRAGTSEFQDDVDYDAGDIGIILYDNITGNRLYDVNAKTKMSSRNKKFPKLVSDYKIRQFFKLITPIDKVSVEGKFAILDQVKALYESIRHKARK